MIVVASLLVVRSCGFRLIRMTVREDFSNAEVLRSLQQLLRTRAANDLRQPEVIISAAPQVWVHIDLDDSLLVDVSRVLGISSPWTVGGPRHSNSQVEEFVDQQFVDAGWPSAIV